jgi:putative molybdopterin biosynthesis protein
MKSRKAGAWGAKEFYTVSQLAELLQLTEMTIYRMVDRGELPHYKIGRVKRFRTSDIEQFLSNRRKTGRATGGSASVNNSSIESDTMAPREEFATVKNRRGQPRRG